jgi:hypothetical protein
MPQNHRLEVPRTKDLQGKTLVWRAVTDLDQPSMRASANLVCSNGHIGSLSTHNIDKAGRVTPSVVCATKECDFHEHIRLLNW